MQGSELGQKMITPIIMEANILAVEEKMALLRQQQQNRVHIDIGDGLFSELLTVAPADLQAVNMAGFGVDLHLLVDDPVEWIEECVALAPERVIGQIERMGSQKIFVETVLGYGCQPALGLMIETPVDEIEKESLESCKTILLLAVPAGTTKSPFDERVLPKIAQLRKIYQGKILVDGGINKTNYQQVIERGADEVGANSSWWRGDFNG